MTERVYVVGTGTGVGKTAVVCALLRSAARERVEAIPYKPAQSGRDDPSDIDRLLHAAALDPTDAPIACPLQLDAPLAPGVAEDPAPFTRPPAANASPDPAPIRTAAAALAAWEESKSPALTLIEGAGGLHVPMPGGTWQSAWISALANSVIVVGAAGLGTINHTLLTIEALQRDGAVVLGFYLSELSRDDDPSRDHNPQIIAIKSGVAHLGTLPFARIDDPPAEFIRPLLHALFTDTEG